MKVLYRLIIYFLLVLLLLSACVSNVQPSLEPVNENLPSVEKNPMVEPSKALEENNVNTGYLNIPQIEFGYANIDGSKLIVLFDHDVDDNSSLTYFGYAVGENGNVYEIQYSMYQERNADDNGRQSAINFDNEPGCIYDIIGKTAIPDKTYALLTHEEYEKMAIFQEAKGLSKTNAPIEMIEKCANAANRGVNNGWLLCEYQNDYRLSMIQFEKIEQDLLAWLVLEGNETFQHCEFPATLVDDGYSAWRYGDCGELSEYTFYILCMLQYQNATTVYLGWYGEEGEVVVAVEFSPDKMPVEKTVCGRYTLY